MRQVKKGLALLLTLLMLIGCLPTAVFAAVSPDYSAKFEIERTSEQNFNSQDVAKFSFVVNANGKNVGNLCSLLVVYDTSVFQLLNKGAKVQNVTTTGWSTNIGNAIGVSTYEDDNYNAFTSMAYACSSEDGSQGYLMLQPTLSGAGTAISEDTALMSVYFGLAEGVSWDAIPSNAIRLATMEESAMLNQSGIVIINDGDKTNYIYGYADGEDTLAQAELSAVGYTPVKPAYTGTQAAVPVVEKKQGGSVTLKAQAIDGATVEYAYSTSNAVPTSGWQDGTEFTNIPAGTYYFFARVKETDQHQAGTAAVSEAVTVYDAPTIEYKTNTLTGLKVGQAVTAMEPTVTGGAPELTYSAEGLLAGLTINEDTGVISGAPATTAESGSATITVTDAEGQIGTTTVTWEKVSGQSLSKDNFTYADTNMIYNGDPVKADVAYAGEITMEEAGAITVYYEGADGTDYAKSADAPKAVGTYTVSAKNAGGTKYEVSEVAVGTLTITPATITVTSITVAAKEYDGNTTATITKVDFSGKCGSDDVSVAFDRAAAAFADAAVGENKAVTVSGLALAGADAANYTLADVKVNVTGTITPAKYTVNSSEEQSVVVGVGAFTQPSFTGVNGEAVEGKLSYSYNGQDMTYDQVVAELAKLAKGATVTVKWSFAANSDNYVVEPVTGTIRVTLVDIIFQVGGQPVSIENALTVKQNPVYGDTWEQIVKITGSISATVDKAEVPGTYSLSVTGRPDAGNRTYQILFNADDSSKYQNVEVLTGTVDVAQLEAVLAWENNTGLVYDGAAKNVTAKVTNLVGEDECTVTVAGGDKVDAGTYTATATALSNNNYKLPENASMEYTIAPKAATLTVTVEPAEFEYDGTMQQPKTVTVKDGETVLKAGTDYTVEIPESTDVGTYTVKVTGVGNYAGSTGSTTYAITKVSQADLVISQIADKTYGDEPFEITVTGGSGDGKLALTSSDTSILSLALKADSDNVWIATIRKAGTVTLKASKGEDENYKEAIKEVEVTIAPKSMEGFTVTLPEDYAPVYSGSAFTPAVTVKDGETELKLNTDYTVTYTDNVNAGTATVTVNGTGNYTGTLNANFTISKAPLDEMIPTLMGEAKVGSVLTAKLAGVGSGEYTWKWYCVVDGEPGYEELTALAGQASFVVTTELSNKTIYAEAVAVENGNYTGVTKSSEPVTVAKQAISGTVVITAEDTPIAVGTELTAVTTAVTPDVDLTYQWNVDGKAVEDATGAAYTVQEADAEKSITVTVTAAGDYEGSITSAPVVVGKTVLSGTPTVKLPDGVTEPVVDTVLTADLGGIAPESCTIQWLRDGVVISGATGETYTVGAEDRGHSISFKLTGTGEYTGELMSDGVNVEPTVPAAPAVTASAGNGKVTVSWKVSDNGGLPVTGYVLTYGEYEVKLDAETASYVVTGLTNDTEYTFTVVAINGAGESAPGSANATPTQPSGGGGGGGGVTTYAITVEKTENGDVTVSSKTAAKDKTVTITVTPDEGYELASLTVTDKNGDAVALEKTDDGQYTFTMPASKVSIQAQFQAIPPFQFSDVDPEGWAAPYIYDLYDQGVVEGVGGDLFAPTRVITRAEFVKMLAGVAGVTDEDLDGAHTNFTDVEPDSWYEAYVAWAVENQVTNGTSETTFSPTAPINREQMATMIYRFAEANGVELPETYPAETFVDADTFSDWSVEAISAMQQAGIINGVGGNRFAPTVDATREQACKMLSILLDIMEG